MILSIANPLVRRAQHAGARLMLAGVAVAAMGALAVEATAQTFSPVRNVATANYMVEGQPQAEAVSDPAIFHLRTGDTAGVVEILQYAGPAGAEDSITLGGTEFSLTGSPDGDFTAQPETVIAPDGAPVDASGAFAAEPADSLVSGTTAILRVTDAGANFDPAAIDTIVVILTAPETGDRETLRLYETAPDSGVFTGHAPTGEAESGTPGDGVLSVLGEGLIEATYSDKLDPTDTNTAIADVISRLDTVATGGGRVFDSRTGELIDGARITLMSAETGEPAALAMMDGARQPSSVMSGQQAAIDPPRAPGTIETVVGVGAPGAYIFPHVSPGAYYLHVAPPEGYHGPSVVEDAVLQRLPGAPWRVSPGGRGEVFEMVAGGAIQIDIPLDIPSNLQLQKTTRLTAASVGDFVPYELTLTNRSGRESPPLKIRDVLPEGFRYQQGSLRVDGQAATVEISGDGETLTIAVPPLSKTGRARITYIAEITVAASSGEAVNTAMAYGKGGFSSNTAEADVQVSDPFMRERLTILGRVSAESCDLTEDWPREIREGESLAGVRIYMEDGRHVTTDEDGLYHFEGIRPGTHVVQVDTTTLPEGYEPALCEENTRFAGTPHSQMVDAQGGALWRANFYMKRVGAAAPATGGDAPANAADTAVEGEAETSAALVEKYGADWLAGQAPGLEWVYPDPEAGVPLPGVKFGVKHPANQRIEVFLDDAPISPLNQAATTRLREQNLAITHWRGVDIREGANRFTVVVTDRDGRETARLEHEIHYVTEVRKIRFAPELSRLEANGRTPPEIAFRVTDGAGRPVHKGAVIEVDVEPPYRALTSKERFDARPLTEGFAARGGAVVGDDGVAVLRLEPTLRSGVARLNVKLAAQDDATPTKTIEAWLKPEQRDWILVGIAEGTVGLGAVRRNIRRGIGEGDISTDGRVAFFAKGAIKGEWLLTIAVDTDRKRGDRDRQVFRQIDPNAYYTLYGDAAAQDYEAESSFPLYIKLERENFYAMLGDYDTGMGETELTRFERRLSGLKSAYRDETFDVVAFGASTNQSFVKEELLSKGTSGPYRLQSAPIVRNSETVVIETRDRFRNDLVLETRPLVRFLDYSIDYESGVVTLRQPIPVTDPALNPNVLSFEYESVNPASRKPTFGGRAAMRLADDRVELGASFVHEGGALGRPDSKTDLGGVDLRVELAENTELRAEYARSRTRDGDQVAKGEAIFAEVTHSSGDVNASAQFRQEDSGFGVGQLSTATGGFRRIGAKVDYNLRDAGAEDILPGATALRFEAFTEESLDLGATRNVAEAAITHQARNWDMTLGGRYMDYDAPSAEDAAVMQLFTSGRYNFETLPLSLYTVNEISVSGSSGFDFDNRYMVGADYRLTQWLSASASYEYSDGADIGVENLRAGVSATPWTGATITAAAQNQMGFSEDGDRLSAVFGVGQSVRLTDRLSVTGAFEHQRLLAGERAETPGSPFTNALVAESYTVGSLGFGYVEEAWSASVRAEMRIDDEETRIALNAGLVGDLSEDLSVAGWLNASQTRPRHEQAERRQADLSLAAAYRPLDDGPIHLNRLDLSYASDPSLGTTFKVVDNFSSNFLLGERGQGTLHVGAKYMSQEIDGEGYEGLSYFAGAELRYDLTQRLDIGLHGAAAHSVNSGVIDYALGVSAGYNVFENAWVSLGYNFRGLSDSDYGDASFSADGAFLRFRLNFDQNSVREALSSLRGDR